MDNVQLELEKLLLEEKVENLENKLNNLLTAEEELALLKTKLYNTEVNLESALSLLNEINILTEEWLEEYTGLKKTL